jgi:putative FmdB family regulatory protein
MPTYEYFCRKCRFEFEQFQNISADPIKVCPRCGKSSVERKISSGGGLIFKGSGFYATDYARQKPADKEKETKSEKSKKSGEKTTPVSKDKTKDS